MSEQTKRRPRRRRWKWPVLALLSVLGASVVVLWLSPVLFVPDVEPFFSPAMPQDVRWQLNHLYHIMEDPARRRAALEELRRQNPEWDCIAQAFFGYALANVALKYPAERKRALACMDVLIEETVKVPWREFLLSYGRNREFVRKPESSLMVDGELSLLIGLRRLVRDEPGYRHRDEHERLVQLCVEAMEASPVLCAESYPDECWLFCNGLALASIKVFDVVEGTDHSDLFHRWEKTARERLLEPKTGLLCSAVTLDGTMVQPPEGSCLWVAV